MENHKLSKLQEAEFDILKTFIRICEENNLRYFLCYGSMIGAVRHQGFIPWDDDVDVAMPRPDYERFSHIADRGSSGASVFQHLQAGERPYYSFCHDYKQKSGFYTS